MGGRRMTLKQGEMSSKREGTDGLEPRTAAEFFFLLVPD